MAFETPPRNAERSGPSFLGTGVGPLITGASAELTGGYVASSLVFVGLCIPVLGLALELRAPDAPVRASTV